MLEIEYKIADSDSEKRGAYRLRYDVFTLECGYDRYADHEKCEYRDQDDSSQSLLFIAKVSDSIVATARLKFLKNGPFIGAKHFQFPKLAGTIGIETKILLAGMACADRGAVAASIRGAGVFTSLYELIEQTAVKNGMVALVSAVAADRTRLHRYYHSALSLRSSSIRGMANGLECIVMYKVLNELPKGDHLRAV